MISLNENNDLIYTFEDAKIEVSKLYEDNEFFDEKINLYKNLSYDIILPSFTLKFKYKKHTFDLFMTGIKFTLIEKEISGIFYSYKHLNQILLKYKYTNPIYRQIKSNNFAPLTEAIKLNTLGEIYIKENKDLNKYDDIYDNMNKNYCNENIKVVDKKIKLEWLSVNFKKYFLNSDAENINLDKELSIFKTSYRVKIFSDVTEFLESNAQIYAICGPFGIGKSFTSLILQKQLLLSNYSTLYVNLLNSEEIDDLKETLIKEAFFLILSKEKYVSLADKILKRNANNIWDIISLIDEYCFKEKINFLLILDQYKKDRDINDTLSKLKVKSIFLLSSINDKDVKANLVSQIQENTENLKFKYIYYISLGLEDLIRKKYSNYEDIKVVNCLEDFNFFPNSINLLENIFHWNVLDFYNNQYYTILKKISKFYKKYRIDYLSSLVTNEIINDSKTTNPKLIGKDEFLENINDIPLKYISYVQNINKNYYELYYAFDYVKYPMENEINNYIGLQRFKTDCEASLKGGEFENIIKHKFILDRPLFKIDSFISVNKIVNMELSEEYKSIKIDDLKNKNCIFIYQHNFFGENYDFAILYPKEEKIILIQAKYKLNSSNVTKRSSYSSVNSVSIITTKVSEKFGINIQTIYLLYISSIEYNYSNKDSVFKLLNSKQIICIFYSIMNDIFTSDFKNELSILLPTKSMEIFPDTKEYTLNKFSKKKNQRNYMNY